MVAVPILRLAGDGNGASADDGRMQVAVGIRRQHPAPVQDAGPFFQGRLRRSVAAPAPRKRTANNRARQPWLPRIPRQRSRPGCSGCPGMRGRADAWRPFRKLRRVPGRQGTGLAFSAATQRFLNLQFRFDTRVLPAVADHLLPLLFVRVLRGLLSASVAKEFTSAAWVVNRSFYRGLNPLDDLHRPTNELNGPHRPARGGAPGFSRVSSNNWLGSSGGN